MRPLTEREIDIVSGAESISYRLPVGMGLTTTLEPNSSTTLRFTNVPGLGTYTWNSGVAVTCYTFASGFTLMAGIFPVPGIGVLVGALAKVGCTELMTSDDGD